MARRKEIEMKRRGKGPALSAFVVAALVCLAITGMSAAKELKIPLKHPIDLSEKTQCSSCHQGDITVAGKSIDSYNHTQNWPQIHRYYASSNDQVCMACHQVSFCTSCHAYKEEMKPSTKNPEEPELDFPHRGDYLYQHRIDGRNEPMKCFRCHGRQNNARCQQCHK